MILTPSWPIPLGHKPIDLDLRRIRILLERLGNPHHKLPPTIHIAGTNGKGSTIAFLQSILQHAGYTVHTYTSPHLVTFNERIKIHGELITDALLNEVLDITKRAAGGLNVTFFEGTTAAAFLAFSKVKADFLLLETGMGGRLDATNVIEHPILTLITTIEMDHEEFLGDNIAKIAYEKAGIIKFRCPCISNYQRPEAHAVISKVAKEKEAPMYEYLVDWKFGLTRKFLHYWSVHKDVKEYSAPSLLGEHQQYNAAHALAALDVLGIDLPDEIINKALSSTKHPGRMQRLPRGLLHDCLPPGWDIWIDGGHNPAAGKIIKTAIIEHLYERPFFVISGMLKTKNYIDFLNHFIHLSHYTATVAIPDEPSYSAEELADYLNKSNHPTYAASSLQDALSFLSQFCPYHVQGRVFICGSLHLLGHVYKENNTLPYNNYML